MDKLSEFGRRCFIALRLNSSLVDESTRPHHVAMIEYFNKFANDVGEYGISIKAM